MDRQLLRGKVALVGAGARVAMMDINEARLHQSAADVREAGGDDCVLTVVGDVSNSDDAERAVKRTNAELGGLHILVNNADVNPRSLGFSQSSRSDFWETPPAAWDRVLAVNLSGPFTWPRPPWDIYGASVGAVTSGSPPAWIP